MRGLAVLDFTMARTASTAGAAASTATRTGPSSAPRNGFAPSRTAPATVGRRAAGKQEPRRRGDGLLSTEEKAELAQLRREVRELRRANEVLRTASAFFAAQLDPTRPR
ncbi:hypothetical protein OH809_42680 [Streptomyces sp. NBC_00873]|nr:hypothetical protein OH809_01030 [Streptomyces sp. NBC_00873]WSY97453.1 hypothetical protein OH809_42680 [Streptomyces sp. NBC_00873]WTA49088.1 hypothetical protein OH821_01025 [Streptomyces sp. NBC_00842]WTA49124.1 hypothetical protein OH821_42790 [Streptomyces sp. NBC_00842]